MKTGAHRRLLRRKEPGTGGRRLSVKSEAIAAMSMTAETTNTREPPALVDQIKTNAGRSPGSR
jgi:hypothetical protein